MEITEPLLDQNYDNLPEERSIESFLHEPA